MQTMALRLVSAAVYFCCVEALHNAAKYAGEAATTSGTGLANIVDRVGALGGRLAILARPGTGTSVCGSVPAEVVER